MDLLNHLAVGFGVATQGINLLYALIGAMLGTLIGVLPGIGPVATIAMLLPTTYALQPVSALIMLAGIYYGAQYGGSTTSILLNMPGEVSSAVTCLDGYQMARKGQAGAALSIAALGSFFAGTVATVMVATVAIPLSELALKFGPAEYFSLMTLGLIGSVVLAHGSLLKAIAMIVLGLLLGIVGTDVNSGVARFAFGIPELTDGIGVVSVAMGLFGFAEIISNLEITEKRELITSKVRGLWPTKAQFKLAWPAVAARHRVGLGPGSPSRRRRAARVLRFLRARKEGLEGPVAVRQGCDPGRCGSRIGEQRRRADVVHSAADARHSRERGDGADGRRHDHPQHPAGPAGDDVEPDAVLGPDRLDVGRQPDARDPQSAADRHVDQAAARCPTACSIPAILLFCCIGVYSINNTSFDVYTTAVFGSGRLRLHEAGAASRRRCCSASSSAR